MAKKTRKVLKQQSQQRAIQQAQANVSTINEAPAVAEPVVVTAPVRAAKVETVTADQEFAFVKSDVRRSLLLATIFISVMLVLSFIVH